MVKNLYQISGLKDLPEVELLKAILGLMVIISVCQSLTLKNVGLFVVGEGRHL